MNTNVLSASTQLICRLVERDRTGESSTTESTTAAASKATTTTTTQNRQRRRKPNHRRPKYYWTNPANLKLELQLFWIDPTGQEISFVGNIEYLWLDNSTTKVANNDETNADSSTVDPMTNSRTTTRPKQGAKSLPTPKKDKKVLIPNEMLLRYFGRHDLRAAIASQGGRSVLQETLPARIMAGRWETATQNQNYTEVYTLIQKHSPFLSMQQSPYAALLSQHQQPRAPVNQQDKVGLRRNFSISSKNTTTQTRQEHSDGSDRDDKNAATTTTTSVSRTLWSHHTETRKPKGYWDLQRVLCELYQYMDLVKQERGRPSVWMPRLSEIAASGRPELSQALRRYFGGTSSKKNNKMNVISLQNRICSVAGMIPYQEWHYFEGQLELLTLLNEYLDEFRNGDYSTFPTVYTMKQYFNMSNGGNDNHSSNGSNYEKLHALIQYYGGRKFLSARLSMNSGCSSNSQHATFSNAARTTATTQSLSWGAFDLVFAIRLLNYVREDLMQKSPPLALSSPQPSPSSSSGVTTATKKMVPMIWMPSRSKLLQQNSFSSLGSNGNHHQTSLVDNIEGRWLDEKIMAFGGYENVARRLGLMFFSSPSSLKHDEFQLMANLLPQQTTPK
ncbi:hypothetical protein ACA910_021444 [Epithemia clementina (nom. ined.)]